MRIWSHLLKKFLMENFISVQCLAICVLQLFVMQFVRSLNNLPEHSYQAVFLHDQKFRARIELSLKREELFE